MSLYLSNFSVLVGQTLLGSAIWHYRVVITMRGVKPNLNGYHIQNSRAGALQNSRAGALQNSRAGGPFYYFTGLPDRLFSDQGQHLPPFGVLLVRGVKTLAQLKAGNQSVTS
jgi:hypothetical protein